MVAGADGAPPDGVWFWGGGAFPPVASAAPVVTWAAAHDHSGAAHLARGLALAQGRVAGELPADYAALAQHGSAVPTLVALPRSTEDALARDWLAPALRALEHHRLQHLIVVGGGAATRSWTAGAPSRWQRLRLRFGLPAHAAPA
jgi:hypothetical protein